MFVSNINELTLMLKKIETSINKLSTKNLYNAKITYGCDRGSSG